MPRQNENPLRLLKAREHVNSMLGERFMLKRNHRAWRRHGAEWGTRTTGHVRSSLAERRATTHGSKRAWRLGRYEEGATPCGEAEAEEGEEKVAKNRAGVLHVTRVRRTASCSIPCSQPDPCTPTTLLWQNFEGGRAHQPPCCRVRPSPEGSWPLHPRGLAAFGGVTPRQSVQWRRKR